LDVRQEDAEMKKERIKKIKLSYLILLFKETKMAPTFSQSLHFEKKVG